MNHLVDLVFEIYYAAINNKLKWEPSSTKDAFYTKIGDRRVEIVGPQIKSQNQLMIEEVAKNIRNVNMQTRKLREVDTNDWRIVIYKQDGTLELEVGSKNFDPRDFLPLGMTTKAVFESIFEAAENVGSTREREIASKIISDLKNLG